MGSIVEVGGGLFHRFRTLEFENEMLPLPPRPDMLNSHAATQICDAISLRFSLFFFGETLSFTFLGKFFFKLGECSEFYSKRFYQPFGPFSHMRC